MSGVRIAADPATVERRGPSAVILASGEGDGKRHWGLTLGRQEDADDPRARRPAIQEGAAAAAFTEVDPTMHESAGVPPASIPAPLALDAATRLTAGAAALALGLMLIWGVGFAHSQTLHDTAHDVRHGFGFPCH